MTIAVFAAHPDDETLGCGATIAKLAGVEEVHAIFLAEGITSRKEAQNDRVAVADLYRDAEAAAKVLGIESVAFEGFPCLRMDTLPLLDIVWRIEHHIGRLRPTTVYTHHAGDLNRDHQLTVRAVLTATRPLVDNSVRNVYSFETPGSIAWGFGHEGRPFQPNIFVDVSDTIDRKVHAMEGYRSERRDFPHPRSPEALRATARRWGSVAGLAYAEAFELVRSMR